MKTVSFEVNLVVRLMLNNLTEIIQEICKICHAKLITLQIMDDRSDIVITNYMAKQIRQDIILLFTT